MKGVGKREPQVAREREKRAVVIPLGRRDVLDQHGKIDGPYVELHADACKVRAYHLTDIAIERVVCSNLQLELERLAGRILDYAVAVAIGVTRGSEQPACGKRVVRQ